MSERVHINTFDGGISTDARNPAENACRLSQHFDVFTDKNKMTPFRSAEVGDDAVATNMIANYEYDGTTQYGLGVINGGNAATVLTRTDFTGATWSAYQNVNGSARADQDLPFFKFYRKTGKLYGVRGGRYVWSVDLSGPSANNTEADLTAYTNVTNGLVHSKDDCLYLGYHDSASKVSYIARNNNGSWNVTALALPSNLIPVSISEYGNYLAIACRELGGLRSRVFLWDRDSSLATLAETIDWGEGNIAVIEELEGYLVGVGFIGTTGSFSFKGRTVFRYYAGASGAKQFSEITGFTQAPALGAGLGTGLGCFKQKARNRVLFSASVSIGTSGYIGVWSIGVDSAGTFAVNQESVLLNTASAMYGFRLLGDYLFISYVNSSTWYMDKTNDTEAYTSTSVRETVINPKMIDEHKPLLKQLESASLNYESLPTAGQAVLKVRVDGKDRAGTAGAWDTVFTETGNAAMASENGQAADGEEFTSGRDIEFRIESTGGAEITGINYKYKVLETLM